MDIGALISSPTRDPDWVKKCAITGLITLIPIAGPLNLMGWMKATYAHAKVGDTTLPEANLNYISAGWALFLAQLPLVLVLFGWQVISFVLFVARLHTLAGIANLLGLVVYLGAIVVMPALTYRHVVHGKRFADGFDFADIARVITGNTSAFINYALVAFLASVIAGMGGIACGLGVIITLPFGMAISANNIHAFEQRS